MKNSTTHQALIELEESLINLDSARTQVDKVSEKGELVINEFAKLAKLIESLQQEFQLEKSSLGNSVNRSLKSFNTRLTANADDISSNVKDLNLQFSTLVSDSVKKLNDFHLEVEINGDAYKTSLAENLENFKKVLQKNSKDVITKADEQTNYFFKIIYETSQKLNAFEEYIDAASEKILSPDYESNFKDIKSETRSISKSLPSFITESKEIKAEIKKINANMQSLVTENNLNHQALKEIYESQFQSVSENITELTITIEEERKLTIKEIDANFRQNDKALNDLSKKIDVHHQLIEHKNKQIIDLIELKFDELKKQNNKNAIVYLVILFLGIFSVIATVILFIF